MPEEPTGSDPTPPRPTEKELFFAAHDIEDPEKRSAWLRDACGEDERLHQRVCDLLAAEVTEAGGFLEPDPESLEQVVSAVGQELRDEKTDPEADTIPSNSGDGWEGEAGIREQPGGTIGRYKLLQQIGEGGGGVVYMKEHSGAEFVLATIRRDQGRFDEANQLFEAALEAADAKLEAGHPERAPVRIEFATSLARQKKFEAALEHGEQALRIQQNALRAGHPVLEETFDMLSEIHAGLGNTEKVAEYARSADQLRAERRKDNSNR